MRFPFFLILIFLFGCIQNNSVVENTKLANETVPELLANNQSVICSVALNDEKGPYEGKLRINGEQYLFEFRLNGISSELILKNSTYYQKVNQSWISFCADSFTIAEENGAIDPSMVMKIPTSAMNCKAGNVNIETPGNYTNYSKILDEIIANETKKINALGIECELFLFYECEEFENELKEACELCKK